jgi:hypothetical protein
MTCTKWVGREPAQEFGNAEGATAQESNYRHLFPDALNPTTIIFIARSAAVSIPSSKYLSRETNKVRALEQEDMRDFV